MTTNGAYPNMKKRLDWGAAELTMRLWSKNTRFVYAETILHISRTTSRMRSSNIVPGRVFDARTNEPKVSIGSYVYG